MRPWRLPARTTAAEPLAVTSVSRSHVGLARSINEDRVLDCAERRLWAVADGMGGHGGGDIAAQAVVDALRRMIDTHNATTPTLMLTAVDEANGEIVARNEALSEAAGSTVVAACMNENTATIAWVGDSRAYLLRGGLAQLTHDHSLVQELVDSGLLTAAAAAYHPRANIVTRALGVGETLEISRVTIDLQAGDRLLLCSDGLSRSLDEADTINAGTLEALADALIAAALRRDGSDNISLVLVALHEN